MIYLKTLIKREEKGQQLYEIAVDSAHNILVLFRDQRDLSSKVEVRGRNKVTPCWLTFKLCLFPQCQLVNNERASHQHILYQLITPTPTTLLRHTIRSLVFMILLTNSVTLLSDSCESGLLGLCTLTGLQKNTTKFRRFFYSRGRKRVDIQNNLAGS